MGRRPRSPHTWAPCAWPSVGEHEGLHFLDGHGFAVLEDDAGADLLAVLLVGHADDLHVLYLGVGVDELLDLLGVDVLAAADDHISGGR